MALTKRISSPVETIPAALPETRQKGEIGSLWSQQVIRFLLVGAGNTIFGYSLYLGGLWAGLPYQAALICATALGATFNFFSFGRLVFDNAALKNIAAFYGAYGVTLLVNLLLLTMLVGSGLSRPLAQASLLPLVVALSFFLNKWLVFGRRI